jgi:hypothetical protein
MREQSVKEPEAFSPLKCKKCKFWVWKIGNIGVCNLTNQTVSESDICDFYKPK